MLKQNKYANQTALMCLSEGSSRESKRDTRAPERQMYLFVFVLSAWISDRNPKSADISTEIRLHCFDKKHSPCLKTAVLCDRDWNVS